ncbi:MAG: hypothetical protein ABII74_05965 [Elusimicrobiota bacterium]
MDLVEERVSVKKKVSRKKKTVAKTSKALKTPRTPKEAVPFSIDFPVKGKVITSPDYCIRLSAVPGNRVEISVDGGQWNLCRESAGFWWFEWADYAVGNHTLSAQIVTWDGKVIAKIKSNCAYRPSLIA